MADAQCDSSGISKSAERTSVFGEENTRSSHEGDQQMLVVKEEVPDLWSSSLDQQNPTLFWVKNEDWNKLTDPDRELLIAKKEPDTTDFPFTAVTVKIEDNDENLLSSERRHIKLEDNRKAESPTSCSHEQMGTESGREERRGPEADRNTECLNPNTDENASASSETEVSDEYDDDGCDDNLSGSGSEQEDSDEDWEETRTHQAGGKSSSRLDDANRSKTEQNSDSHKVLNESKVFVCDDCGKPFYYLYHLKRHMAHHKGEKPFQCDECGKKFTLRGNLNQHMTIHRGEKPFACNFCDRRFRLSSLLQSHVVTHLGVKAFTCQHCGERFSREGALKRHVVRHTGVKPFACTICDKRFYRKPDLKCHMPVHSREQRVNAAPRNFACDECGKRFIHKCHVTRHMITHTREKNFSCDICSLMFKWQSALKRHEKRFHNQ
ncbi:zinc finger protein 32-like [Poeciliopsis prolifica]|uniref:zinc finger protein 32-like n=1 Tax=Poeciliopsis prolifica TaxID=188132 RepID=UPI00241333C6|nr:zinc finger protein 32-like [Poeciliopsis prolifica]XP_054899210.1 zinc finger protein 32-like [Poeciliopsis prolifica]XP_054899211.1 zinc finger protein 32-like [Poeciliopsis prolifica]